MKFLIIGCGSIGKRHIRNLLSIGINSNYINAVDTRDDRLGEVRDLGINNIFKEIPNKKLNEIDCAIICSPTSMHIAQATLLANHKIHLHNEYFLMDKIYKSSNKQVTKKFRELFNINKKIKTKKQGRKIGKKTKILIE